MLGETFIGLTLFIPQIKQKKNKQQQQQKSIESFNHLPLKVLLYNFCSLRIMISNKKYNLRFCPI